MTTIPLVDLKAQHAALRGELAAAVAAVFERADFILGREVEEFERAFASLAGTAEAIGVSSGLDALRLALLALEVQPGDEVIVPANTYIATALAVSAVGARPLLVDCDPRTYNLDAAAAVRAMSPRVRAILAPHLAGQPADLDPILEAAAARAIAVVEDAAQAHGARYKGRACGSLGRAGCFSFYPSKNLGACGDGGIVTTSDATLAAAIRTLRNYGQRARHEHVVKGLNARLDTLQAAILSVKLPHLAGWNQARRAHAGQYRALLAGAGDVRFQHQPDFAHSVYHLFVIETGRRDALREHLARAGIQTAIHYPVPIHLQPAYADLGYRDGDFPHSERLARTSLSLPMYAELTGEQIERVSSEIRRFFDRAGRREMNPTSAPTVSAIVPVFNGEATVARAIESALAQRFDGTVEVIAVNDGSTDATADVLRAFSDRIRVLEQENRGLSAARNSGVRASSGRYLAFLDADDAWMPGKLAISVAALDEAPGAVMVYSDAVQVDAAGNLLFDSYTPAGQERAPSLDEMLAGFWSILPSTIVVRRPAFERVGGFCEEFRGFFGEDIYFYLLLLEHGPFRYLARPLVRYYRGTVAEHLQKRLDLLRRVVGDASGADALRRTLANYDIFVRLIGAHFGPRARRLAGLTRRAQANQFVTMGLAAMAAGRRETAARCYRHALECDALNPKTYARLGWSMVPPGFADPCARLMPRRLAASLAGRSTR
jgi:dTDP-3-amino-3,4,6-trideoxy-alpha-D-glucose transaminase